MMLYPHRHNASDTEDCIDPTCPLNRLVATRSEYRAVFGLPVPVQPAQILPKPSPGLIRRAMNFGKALVNHLAAGSPKTTDLEATARQSICESCTGPGGFYIAETDTCAHPSCGCKIRRKSRWKDQKCPLGKW